MIVKCLHMLSDILRKSTNIQVSCCAVSFAKMKSISPNKLSPVHTPHIPINIHMSCFGRALLGHVTIEVGRLLGGGFFNHRHTEVCHPWCHIVRGERWHQVWCGAQMSNSCPNVSQHRCLDVRHTWTEASQNGTLDWKEMMYCCFGGQEFILLEKIFSDKVWGLLHCILFVDENFCRNVLVSCCNGSKYRFWPHLYFLSI